MVDFKQLENELNNIGSIFLDYSKENRESSSYRAYKNKLAAKLWCYAEEFRKINYNDIEDYDFEDAISDTILSCLSAYKNGDSIVKLFKTALHRNVFKDKTEKSKRGIKSVSNDVIKLGRELKKWAEWKGLSYDINKRNSEIDKKLFEYGRSWGKSDLQIKKALDWLDKKTIIEGNKDIEEDGAKTELFDFISGKDFSDYNINSENSKEKIELYIRATNDVYCEQKNKSNINDSFLSKYFTNLILAVLIKENVQSLEIANMLKSYEIIDKIILNQFCKNRDWKPNTNRKSIGLESGVNESSIGNTWDRFEKVVLKKYSSLLKD